MRLSMRKWLRRGFAAAVCLGAFESPGQAQTTFTWGGASGGNWSTAGNWSPGLPVSSLTNTDILFSGTTSLVTTVDLLQGGGGGTFDIRTLTFDSSAGTFNITPTNTNVTTLRLGAGGITNNSASAQTISNPLALGGSQTWSAAAGGLFIDAPVNATGQTLTFAGGFNTVVTGNVTGGTLIKTGAGNVTLSGNNTTAGVNVGSGVLIVNKVGTGSPIGTGPVTLSGGTLSFRVFGNPVSVSGFNADVITAVSEFGAGAPYGTTRAVDGANGGGSFVYFQQGANAANPTFGAPASGRFTSLANSAVTYQLGDYTGNNVLSFGSNTAGSAATTLTIDTPGVFRSISILNVTGSGSATFSFTLNFADGTTTTVSNNTSPDWFNGTALPTVFAVNGRLNRDNGNFDSVGSGNPRIYARDYTLAAGDQSKTLNSITFATTNTGGYTFNVFGLAGTAGSDTQVFTNPVTVTADSTLDQQNVSNVTLGTLAIGTNTLNTSGSTGSTMTVGATTLTGNPTFSPGQTLVLGALNDGGTARNITKTGTGTLTLSAPATSLVAGTTVNLNAGTTNLTATGALGTQAALVLSTGATLSTSANQTVRSLAGTGGAVALGSNTLTIGGGTATTFAGSIGNGSVVVTGSNTVQTFTGSANATAFTVQSNGKLASSAAPAIGSGGVTISGTSTLSLGVGATAPINITGFGGSGTGFNLQGSTAPTVAGDVMTLTPNVGSVAASAWYGTQIPVGPFNASFRYSQLQGTNAADGATFTIQSQSATAVGTAGGGLGYATITPSVALAINIYGPNTPGINFTANGAQPASPYLSTGSVNFQNAGAGNEITVALSYDGVNLNGTLTQGANTFTLPTTAVDIASIVGPTGYIGFTGGTGGVSAQQNIDNFSFTTPDASVYASPVSLSASAAATIAVNFNANGSSVTIPTLAVGAGASLTVQADSGTSTNTSYGLVVSGATTLAGASTFNVLNNGTGTGTLTLNAVSGAGSITKSGTGTLAINGAGFYTGTTTVSAGTLQLNGNGSFATSPVVQVQAGAVLNVANVTGGANFANGRFTLANGQTLRGSGTIQGALGAASGATISPGTPGTPGNLTVNGNVAMTAGSTFSVQLNGATAGTQYSQMTITGAASTLDLANATLSATLTGFTPTGSTKLYIILNAGTTTATTFLGLPQDGPITIGGFNALISYRGIFASSLTTGGNDVVIYNFQPVPEPAALLLVGAALFGVIRRRRGA